MLQARQGLAQRPHRELGDPAGDRMEVDAVFGVTPDLPSHSWMLRKTFLTIRYKLDWAHLSLESP